MKKILLYCLFFSLVLTSLRSHEEREEFSFDEAIENVITIESALARILVYNRDIIEGREQLQKADLSLSTEQAFFSWDVSPDGIFGYTNGPHKHKDSDLSYGIGLDISKRFSYGSKLYVSPSISKKGKGFQIDASATMVQPLFRGCAKGVVLSRIYGAKFSRRAAYRQFFTKQVKTIQEGIRRLYNVAKQEAVAIVNEESVVRLTHLVKSAKLKEKAGLATATDIYRAEHELKNAEERYSSSMVQINDAKDSLREILALPEDAPIIVSVPLVDVTDEFPQEFAIETALQNRIEVDQAQDALREAKRLSRVEKHELLPEVNLVLEFTNSSYYDSFRVLDPDDYHKYWKVGLTASRGLSTQANLNRFELSRLALDSAVRNVERVTEGIIREVKHSWRLYDNIKNKIEIQKKQAELSEVSLNLSTLKFNRGLANNLDLIEAEKNLQQEKIRLHTQIIDHMLEFVNLRVAMGVFCEKPIIPF